MKHVISAIVSGIGLLLLAGVILIACDRSGQQHESMLPTAAQDIPVQCTNYYASEGVEGDLKVYIGKSGKHLFALNVLPGAYRLDYYVHKPNNGGLWGFVIDFEAIREAALCIGLLDGDILEEAMLFEDQSFSGEPVHAQGPLRLYAFPGGWAGWTEVQTSQAIKTVPQRPAGIILYRDGMAQVPTMKNPCVSSPPSTPLPAPTLAPTPVPFLFVSLAWENPVNLDLNVTEPDGSRAGVGINGTTAVSNGDNDCGFGNSCDSVSCSDLACNTPEQIHVAENTTLPGVYQIIADNGIDIFAGDQDVTLTVNTQSQSKTFACTIHEGRTMKVHITFPAGAIEEKSDPGAITCP